MALSSLTLLKQSLGIASGDTSEDAALAQWLAQAVSIARKLKKQWIGGLLSANTVANPTVVTSIGHGLQSGETITILGSNCTPTIDGARVVTVISRDTFSVPVTVTIAGTAGSYSRTVTEFYDGDGSPELLLRNRPVQSVTSVYEDPTGYYGDGPDAFASGTLLTAGTDYVLVRDRTIVAEQSRIAKLIRLNSMWPGRVTRGGGMLASNLERGQGNIKVTSVIGYSTVPEDVIAAVNLIVALIRSKASTGQSVSSESLDYYSYDTADVQQAASDVTSVRSLLGLGKEWVW